MLFRYISTVLLCCAAYLSHAQSLQQEQAKLANLQNQHANLTQLNSELATNVERLSDAIVETRAQSSEFSEALKQAEDKLEAAKAAHKQDPSIINEGRVDNAQFKYAIALRRYQKNNPELVKLVEERQELQKAFEANEITLESNSAVIQSQIKLIAQLEKEEAHAAEQRALAKAQQALKKAAPKPAEDLKADEEELQTALAEVQRLRQILAKQKQNLIKQKQDQLAAENRLSKNLKDANLTQDNETLNLQIKDINEEAYWQQLADQQTPAASELFDKFLSIKTYEGTNLSSRKTAKLKHIGNNIYLAKTVSLAAAKTSFIVAQQEWSTSLNAAMNQCDIVLDLRNKDAPVLTIYPTT